MDMKKKKILIIAVSAAAALALIVGGFALHAHFKNHAKSPTATQQAQKVDAKISSAEDATYIPASAKKPANMRGVWLTAGNDYSVGPNVTSDSLKAQIDSEIGKIVQYRICQRRFKRTSRFYGKRQIWRHPAESSRG